MDLISQEEVLKIAQISNIILSEQEIAQMEKELSQVLEYAVRVARFQGDVMIMQAGHDNVVREDVPHKGLGQVLVSHAATHDHGYFVVPLVLEQ